MSQPDNTNIQEDTFGQGVSIEDFIAGSQKKKSSTSEQLGGLVTSLNSPNRDR